MKPTQMAVSLPTCPAPAGGEIRYPGDRRISEKSKMMGIYVNRVGPVSELEAHYPIIKA